MVGPPGLEPGITGAPGQFNTGVAPQAGILARLDYGPSN